MGNPKFIARLCWNSSGWIRATGEAAELENGTFASENGFGHEEWIFNFAWLLDGWKYSFLQPVNRSIDKMRGQVIDLLLYTVGPDQAWYYVAEVSNVQVLDDEPAALARKEAVTRGWFDEMRHQVNATGGDPSSLSNPLVFYNIAFRPEDCVLYAPMVPVGEKDALRKQRRYILAQVQGNVAKAERDWRKRVAATTDPNTGLSLVSAREASTMSLEHNTLAKHLVRILRRRFGKDQVVAEEDYVDFKARTAAGSILFELKTDPRPRFAVREALGQLLEYAFRCRAAGEAVVALVVLAPGIPTPQEARYFTHLREAYGLPFHYIRFHESKRDLDLSSVTQETL